MDLYQSLLLAFTQGVTEFLPVSSSGHLNILQSLLGLAPSLSLDVFLNTATLFSVFFFFRHQVPFFFSNLKYIIVGSLPAGFVGLLFKDQIELIFSNLDILPVFFFVTSAFVFSTRYFGHQEQNLTYKRAIIIGVFQALAILPGVSRAGSTIFAGLMLGLSPSLAFQYSFSLFIPASLGALLVGLDHTQFSQLITIEHLLSFVVTFVVGIISLFFLRRVLIGQKIWYFSFYTLLLGIILLIL